MPPAQPQFLNVFSLPEWEIFFFLFVISQAIFSGPSPLAGARPGEASAPVERKEAKSERKNQAEKISLILVDVSRENL